ncbi:MAG TPA: PQQ-dependent sugar dehydrogenase [Pyrinomonadaceae bacterium]|nr:PQQ-dependent sugar dehydrogenase [Pyrinomonadaceae bacterium]
MTSKETTRFHNARLIILPSLLAAIFGFLVSHNAAVQPVQAFSSGPPPGYTGAPGEEPEACAECHVPADAGTGHITITAPQTYVPGQTYAITVTHSNPDPTRLRWGFEMTVLDTSDEKAGNLQSLDGLTQILNNAGPGAARQYIEHTSAGTFVGQQNTASWTFNWTAPPTDIGVVTFYVAGNQANNDGNTSGDYIYKTFVTAAPFAATPDYDVSVTPSLRAVVPTASAQYTVTLTPSAGFTGIVNLNATGLPGGASANFNPASVNITDATAKSTTLTISTGAGTPLGDYPIMVNTSSGSLMHSKQVTLKVIDPASVDLSLTKTASPNPGQVGVSLAYRVTVTNNGPASATNVSVVDTLPAGVTFSSASSTVGTCSGTATVTCSVGTLAVNASAIVTITVTPTAAGQISNSATVAASQTDYDPSNNSASINTQIQPAAALPSMVDPNLMVSTVASGLDQPTAVAFIDANNFFVTEKATGKVQKLFRDPVTSAVTSTTVLDLAVNSASERGLLGMALHPQFTTNGYVYLYWSESNTGSDTTNTDSITLLGNRVDRYHWDGSTLSFDKNLIKLHALQQDAGQPSRANHNGGVLRFGPDGKLYIILGDNGRRGFLQNLPTGGPVPDDQFGGPEPDDAHMTGIILRLNDDGTTPSDNPFFNASTSLTGEAAANIKKLFAYGVRNGFGLAFDPLSGYLWSQENGDDAFDEMNRVSAGFNGGWIQVMGPINRIAEFKSIESTYGAGNLQQLRWPPSNIADTPQAALAKLYMLPGAQYTDPEFSWKYAVAPAGIGFVKGRGLGTKFEGDLLVGASRTTLLNGYLFRFKFSNDRKHFKFTDSSLNDLVADNLDKFDQTESQSLVVGQDFGVVTDIETNPNGNVFVVSLINGAIYEIKLKPNTIFYANLTGAQEVPPNSSTATGNATLVLSPDETSATVSLNFSGLSSPQTDAHIHGPAAPGVAAGVLFPLPSGQVSDFKITLTAAQAQDLKNGLWYVNVHSSNFPSGEIRGQFGTSASASTVQFAATQVGVGEGEGSANVTVTRAGNTSAAADVKYATIDDPSATDCSAHNNIASAKCDYQTTTGTLHFAAGQSLATISIPIVDDSYAEGGSENFTVALSNPSGSGLVLSSPNTIIVTINDNDAVDGANPIDSSQFFVRQHYLDFLNREPDPSGFGFWKSQIDSCGVDAQCIDVKRINVSAAFFLSIEFQETGYLVYRTYKSAYGNLTGTPVPLKLNEFLPDTQQISKGIIVGQTGWEQALENNKVAFMQEFVTRTRFTTAFPTTMTPAQFVDLLYLNAGVTPTTAEKNSVIGEFGSAGNTVDTAARARALRRVAENTTLIQQEKNKAFVLMQYFGYLRRNPNDPPEQNLNFDGYNFWLGKLNQFNGNFVQADMVKAFIVSGEYRHRFGP